jgi:hypothetical protein
MLPPCAGRLLYAVWQHQCIKNRIELIRRSVPFPECGWATAFSQVDQVTREVPDGMSPAIIDDESDERDDVVGATVS